MRRRAGSRSRHSATEARGAAPSGSGRGSRSQAWSGRARTPPSLVKAPAMRSTPRWVAKLATPHRSPWRRGSGRSARTTGAGSRSVRLLRPLDPYPSTLRGRVDPALQFALDTPIIQPYGCINADLVRRRWDLRRTGRRHRRDIVLRALSGNEGVAELAGHYPMSFAAVQKHVAVLERAGLSRSSARAVARSCAPTWMGCVWRAASSTSTRRCGAAASTA